MGRAREVNREKMHLVFFSYSGFVSAPYSPKSYDHIPERTDLVDAPWPFGRKYAAWVTPTGTAMIIIIARVMITDQAALLLQCKVTGSLMCSSTFGIISHPQNQAAQQSQFTTATMTTKKVSIHEAQITYVPLQHLVTAKPDQTTYLKLRGPSGTILLVPGILTIPMVRQDLTKVSTSLPRTSQTIKLPRKAPLQQPVPAEPDQPIFIPLPGQSDTRLLTQRNVMIEKVPQYLIKMNTSLRRTSHTIK
jgi:hypothetical protein